MTSRSKRPAWHKLDPHFERESEKYGRAAPSREFILDYLRQRAEPLDWDSLCAAWGITDEWEADALQRRLRAMTREGQLVCNRRGGYGPIAKMDLVRGRVVGHPEGYGFLVADEGGDDLYIPPHEMRALLHGDRVVMCVTGIDRRGRREGKVVEIIERNTQVVVGRYAEEGGIGFVTPDSRRLPQDLIVPPDGRGGARPGQIVVAELIQQPTRHTAPLARVREVLGDHMAPGMEVRIAIVNHGIPTEFPPAALAEAATFGASVAEDAKAGRKDLRKLPLVTIDGISARDFDDAVYCEHRGDNWRLYVAIADVSHYVRAGAALDREALARGNSVYFPDRVIPMLPEALSNGLCSLNPEVDRLCMVCEMTIDTDGQIIRSRFHEAVMRSHARLTYDAVAAMLMEGDTGLRAQYARLVPHLERLYGLYEILRRARERRGAIDFETQETEIEYGADRKIERIVPSRRNDAHKIIEECMIAANVATARYLERKRIPTLYRVHAGPRAEKLEKLRAFLAPLGLALGGGDEPAPADFERLLNTVRDRPDAELIQTVMLRSLSQAVYSPDNSGHFGLALKAYAHFTSPIRRYPDLLVHRAIRHLLQGGKAKEFVHAATQMVEFGEQCSMTERRADDAVRDAVEWLKCEYMLDKVGEEFDGTVAAVTGFGLFVALREVYVEGLIHVTNLPNDYYHFDPVGQRLAGERSGRSFRLGDSVRVRVARVDLDERKIDFEPIEVPAAAGAAPGRGRPRAAARPDVVVEPPPKADRRRKDAAPAAGHERKGGKHRRRR
ncbi:RNAse R [Plasticicumulans lactativorans]|uniref:Ribonuclease R n=1 Tax=Plasticicumulans lactativorans TaxID=1133106 RepID=A0A4R2KVW6_9GAMM|nr:ribonuclease R [Plasticicumulans lactativorans]TCO76977.1 RNAse R [Plasticicumulans lactativorans]